MRLTGSAERVAYLEYRSKFPLENLNFYFGQDNIHDVHR
jgi:hypothetical protein